MCLRPSISAMCQVLTSAPCALPPPRRWYDQEMVRFINDEPIRRAVVDLVGDLALLNDCGNGGMPVGHVVAYRPTHDLQVGCCGLAVRGVVWARVACDRQQMLVQAHPRSAGGDAGEGCVGVGCGQLGGSRLNVALPGRAAGHCSEHQDACVLRVARSASTSSVKLCHLLVLC